MKSEMTYIFCFNYVYGSLNQILDVKFIRRYDINILNVVSKLQNLSKAVENCKFI